MNPTPHRGARVLVAMSYGKVYNPAAARVPEACWTVGELAKAAALLTVVRRVPLQRFVTAQSSSFQAGRRTGQRSRVVGSQTL